MDPLKELLFEKTAQALRSYDEAKKEMEEIGDPSGFLSYKEKVVFARHQRFIALYDVIEEAELEDEYQAWKQAEGIAEAKKRGVHFGRQAMQRPMDWDVICKDYQAGKSRAGRPHGWQAFRTQLHIAGSERIFHMGDRGDRPTMTGAGSTPASPARRLPIWPARLGREAPPVPF